MITDCLKKGKSTHRYISPVLWTSFCDFLNSHKLASSVNLYRFTHFLDFPSSSIFANLLVGATSPIPFERYLRYRLLIHSECFVAKEKTWTAFSVQVRIVVSYDYSYFSIQRMKVLTFSKSASFMVLSFSHNSRYGVFASSRGAKNSAGVISK